MIVGLGNPGSEYARTRHNAGFWFVDELARKTGAFFRDERKFQGEVCRTRIGDSDVWLLKPSTYMNRSGDAVVALALYYKITPDQILVVHDELDLPPGCMKIKQGGGNAGHNGLKDISAKLSTPNFWRLRLGTGHPRTLGMAQQVADFVLSAPSSEHEAAIEDCIGIASRRPVLLQKATSRVSPAVLPSTAIRPSRPRRPPNEAAREPLPARRACRYDGRVKTDLRPPLRAAGIGDDCWISVCPESDGGLPTPRTPSEIRGTARGVLEGRDHIMAADGRDNTACFMKGARIAADLCRENGVRLALLKAKSPSCGFGQVYDGTFTGTLVAGRGLTAELLSDAGVRVLTENDLDLLASLKTQEDPAC